METTLSPGKTASAIWSRVVKPEQADFTPELARAILKLDFDPEDHRRMEELSAKVRKGALSPEERAELEEYVRVNTQLAILQSKARLSLKRAEGGGPSARKAPAKRRATAKKPAANGPASSAGAGPATRARKRLPAATARALKELEAGKLNRYADADELFRKLDIKLGQED